VNYETIADFHAYVRRPKPLAAGLVARLYAQNGADADAVVTLGRTEYYDATVDVALFDGDTEVGGFQGELRRPDPRRDGMVAQVFGANGESADTITALGLGKFLDRQYRVLVRLVRDAAGADLAKPAKGPYSVPAQALWKSSFFRTPAVWAAAGTDAEFRDWITRQPSAHSGEFNAEPDPSGAPRCVAAHVRRVADGFGTAIKGDYACIPLTDGEHRRQHQHGEDALRPREWWDRQRIRHVQRWAWEAVTRTLGAQSMADVSPALMLAWACENGLDRLLPAEYRQET
jgi:hypothetical protein